MSAPPPQPSLSLPGLEGLMWTFGAVAIVLSVGRYWIRYVTISRLRLDDLTHALGLVSMIVALALYQQVFADAYFLTRIAQGDTDVSLSPMAQVDLWKHDQKLQFSGTIFWYTSIWSIKVTLLLLFWDLFKVHRYFKVAWWSVLGYTIATYIVLMVLGAWHCGAPANRFNIEACYTPDAYSFGIKETKLSCALNVTSDFMILLLPLAPMYQLVMKWPQKIAILASFSTGLFVIAVDIARVVLSIDAGSTVDFSVAFALITLEVSVAVILGTVVVYRAFFKKEYRNKILSSYQHLFRRSSRTHTSDHMPSSEYSQNSDNDVMAMHERVNKQDLE